MFAQKNKLKIKQDSIEVLRNLAKDQNLDLDVRFNYAKRASQLSLTTNIDSTILKSNRVLSFVYLKMQKFDLLREINHENLKLAYKLKDSSALAIANYNLGFSYHFALQHDSAYYYYSAAVKIYNKQNNFQSEGELLNNMADIQNTEKDYIGAEVNAIKAISLIQTLPKTDYNLDTLWSLYNLLGIISGNLKLYDKSIEYHEKALTFSNKISDNYLHNLYTNINLGTVYREKKEYQKAIKYFEEILKDKTLLKTDPSYYATTIDNIAYTRFLSKDKNLPEIEAMFQRAYKIADSIEDPIMLMSSSSNMSELYLANNKKDTAKFYAQVAYKISKETNSFDFVSKSLLLLSKINDGEEGKKYLFEHIKLNDSLLNKERNIRNKFARIEFETDKIEAENIKISKERLIFLMSSVGLFISVILIYVIVTQRSKNRKLQFAQQQQEANEEIYNLMLAQQGKLVEGRTQEKKRISQELHDGILGRLFGTRLSLDSLNLLKTDEAIKNREYYINELKLIEQEIRKISHDLNSDFVTGASFIDIVKILIEKQTKVYNLTYTFKIGNKISWKDLSNKTKIHIYRIVQETLQNIHKHAHAKHVKISFQLKNNVFSFSIEDDGKGYNVLKAKKGIGLKNINSRVHEIGGKVEIESEINIGTKISITVPSTK